MVKKITLALLILLLFVGIFSQPARADLMLYPSEDTYVDINDPDTNKDGFGLRTDYSNQPDCVITRRIYLRVDLTPLYMDISKDSRLRVFVSQPPQTSGTLSLWSTTDDWNGAGSGQGDASSLVWNNAPLPIEKLDTRPSGSSQGWVDFHSVPLAEYIINQRLDNGGDNLASFVIQWDSCQVGIQYDAVKFEDHENYRGTNNIPYLYPLNISTAIDLQSFTVNSRVDTTVWLPGGAALLALALSLVLFALMEIKPRRRH